VIVIGIVLLADKNRSKIQIEKVLKKFKTDGMPKANYPKKNTKNKNEL